jgi:hypothetical protein
MKAKTCDRPGLHEHLLDIVEMLPSDSALDFVPFQDTFCLEGFNVTNRAGMAKNPPVKFS